MSSLAVLTGHVDEDKGAFREDARFMPGLAAAPATAPVVPEEDPLSVAWAEGYAQGQADAAALHAESDAAEQAAREKLALNLARLEGELAEELRRRLVETVTELCAATLEPYALDEKVLLHRVERAVSMLSRADDERVIRLNPEDRKLIADSLAADWTVIDDPALPRGSLRVETATGGVEDGPLQWRSSLIEAFAAC